MDHQADEDIGESSKSSISLLPIIDIPKSYSLSRIVATSDIPAEDLNDFKEPGEVQSNSKIQDFLSFYENDKNLCFNTNNPSNDERLLKDSENHPTRSIKIPARSYKSEGFRENSNTLNSESKIFVPKNKENAVDPKDTKNNPLEDIRKKYETLRQELREKSNLKQQRITLKYEQKLKNLEEKTLKKIKSLKELEEFCIYKLKEAKLKIPNDSNSILISESSKSTSPGISSGNMLLNTFKDKILTSTDLKSVKTHRFSFTPGSSYLLLNPSTILINSISCSEIQSLDLSTGSLKSVISHSIPRRYAAFGFIGQHPALIGGLIDSKSTLTDSVEVLKDLSSWQSVSSLNRPRSHGYTLKHKEDTFLLGGFPYDLTHTIERFTNGHWETYSYRFQDKLYGYGLASYKDFIIVFGGAVKNEKHLRGKIFMINTETDEVLEQPLKSLFINYSAQSSVVYDGVLYYLDCIQGKVISQELTV